MPKNVTPDKLWIYLLLAISAGLSCHRPVSENDQLDSICSEVFRGTEFDTSDVKNALERMHFPASTLDQLVLLKSFQIGGEPGSHLGGETETFMKAWNFAFSLKYAESYFVLNKWMSEYNPAKGSVIDLLLYQRLLIDCIQHRSFEVPAENLEQISQLLKATDWPGEVLAKYAQILNLYYESVLLFSKNSYTEALIPAFAALEIHNSNQESIRFHALHSDILYLIGTIFSHDVQYALSETYFRRIADTDNIPPTLKEIVRNNLFFLADLQNKSHIRDSLFSILAINGHHDIKSRLLYNSSLIIGYYHFLHGDYRLARRYFIMASGVFEKSDHCNGNLLMLLSYIANSYLNENNLDSAQYYSDLILENDCMSASLHKDHMWLFHKMKYDLSSLRCEVNPTKNNFMEASRLFHKQQQLLEIAIETSDPHLSDATVYTTSSYLSHLFNAQTMFPVDSIHLEALRRVQLSKSRSLIRELKNRHHDELLDSNPQYRDAHLKFSALLQQTDNFKSQLLPDENIYREIYQHFKVKQQYLKQSPALSVGDDNQIAPGALFGWLKKNNTQFFQFLGTDSSYFVVYFNTDTSGFYKLPRHTVDSCVHIWQNSLDQQEGPLQQHLQFMQKLLLQEYLDPDIQNVVLLPDLNLSQFPFEALMSSTSDPRYLIEDHVVSYHFDMEQLIEDAKHAEKVNSISALSWSDPKTIAAGITEYNELPGGYVECKQLCQLFDVYCELKAGIQMSRKNFERALRSDILHLSTHAFSSDVNRLENYLLLRQEKGAHQYFAYNLPGNDLKHVVLSACESGTGTYLPGEGVYSISREFIRGGCEVVTKSLWKISDRQTSAMLQEYYEDLKNGSTVPEALRTSKISQIKKHGRSAHPSIWAGLIAEGNPFLSFSF